MSRYASLEIHKEEFAFSAGHFTIFSATERERLHGHNYYVSLAFKVKIESNGLSFDYRHYKKKMLGLCQFLSGRFLLPTESPYLNIEETPEHIYAHFNHKKIPFLKEDVLLLPLSNITIEELSYWFLQKLLEDQPQIEQHAIHALTVNVFNGPGQSGGASWEKENAYGTNQMA